MPGKAVVHRIPLTKARINWGHVVRRAHTNREYFILEKDGIPVAGVMSVDDLEDFLELQHPAVKDHSQMSHREYRKGRARSASAFLAELRRSARRAKR